MLLISRIKVFESKAIDISLVYLKTALLSLPSSRCARFYQGAHRLVRGEQSNFIAFIKVLICKSFKIIYVLCFLDLAELNRILQLLLNPHNFIELIFLLSYFIMFPHWLECLSRAISWAGGQTASRNAPSVELSVFVTHFAHGVFRVASDFLAAGLEPSSVVSWTYDAEDFISIINTVTIFIENFSPKIRVFWVVKVSFFILHRPHNVLFLRVKPEEVIIELEFVRGFFNQ